MLKALLSRVPFLRRRAATHRNDQLKSDSDERRARWNQVIAEHQNPMVPHKVTAAATETVTGSPPE